MLIQRFCFKDLLSALERQKITALVGARQTGKTTLLKQLQEHLKQKLGSLFENNHYFCDFDSLAFRQELARDERLLEKIIINKTGITLDQLNHPFYLFIDEVQKYPPVLEILKKLHDHYSKQIKIVITGSSALQIREQGAETLAGRIEYHYIFPFTFSETQQLKELLIKQTTENRYQKYILNLIDYLLAGELGKDQLEDLQSKRTWLPIDIKEDEPDFFVSGLYPEVVCQKSREDKFRLLENYLTTYVERDVRNLTQVGDWQGYHRLLEILASRVGQLVDYSKIGSRAGLDVRTVKKYLSLLEETFIISTLPSYSVNVEKRVTKSPKIIFNDNGLLSLLLKITDLQHYIQLDMIGGIFENAMIAELMKYIKNRPLPCGTYFWRTYAGTEVDCVLESEGRLIPVEIKWANKLAERDWLGLKSFQQEFKKRTPCGYLLYRGREVLYHPEFKLTAIPYYMLFC